VTLTKPQADFAHSRSSIVGFVGGRGAGKTWAGAYRLLVNARPNRQYLVVAPTYTMLRDVVWPVLIEKAMELCFLRDTVRSRLAIILGNGALILCRSADQPDRLRGLNIAGAWLDEASLVPREVFDVVLMTLRETHGAWLACTFTPKGRSHWTYDLFGKPRDGVETVRCQTRENPFLPADFVERVRAQTSATLLQQELEAEFIDIEGADWPSEYWGEWVLVPQLPPRQRWAVSAVAVDPSLGKQDKAGDYSAVVLVAVCDDLLWIAADLQRRSVSKLVRDVLVACDRWRPDLLGFEANQFQELVVHEFERVTDEEFRVKYPVFQIRNKTSKLVRIRRLGPYIARRELRVLNDAGGRLLVQQLQEFPQGQHDDGPDALEMAIRLILETAGGYYAES
jgi:predicted phage terminase large subunit-like protein